MIRRNTRLRKEYLYRKSLAGKEAEQYEKKRKIREALREGKSIPTELLGEEEALHGESQWEDARTQHNTIDDEYAFAGTRDPKICVTTSRDPSSRLKQFAKEVKLMLPNSQRVNRGNHIMSELVDACRSSDFTDIIVVQETRGEPDGLIISHMPFGPTAYFTLSNCVQRHDIEDCGPMSEVPPHIILHNLESKVGLRVGSILKCLFPVPKPDSKRVVTFCNNADTISFRHHMYEKEGKEVILKEVGPRFEMQLYRIRQGTLDQKEADDEWVLRPYMNSAKRHRVL